jgi:hypothetical protein
MLAAIVYTLGSFIVASIITFLLVIFKPVHVRDEMRSWRLLLGMFVFCFSGPYLYNEALTRIFGKDMEKAVQAGYMDVPIDGPLRYYKVTKISKNKAKVLVIAKEKQEWGGTDTPMITLNLEKKAGGWRSTSFKILNSERLDRETYVFPVYW